MSFTDFLEPDDCLSFCVASDETPPVRIFVLPDGKFHGKKISLVKGETKEETWNNGILKSVFNWDDKGRKTYERTFDGKKKHTISTSWRENGKGHENEWSKEGKGYEYQIHRDWHYDSEHLKEYNENAFYNRSKGRGILCEFFPSGKISTSRPYLDGRPHGESLGFSYKTGEMGSVIVYEKGKRVAHYKVDEDGRRTIDESQNSKNFY